MTGTAGHIAHSKAFTCPQTVNLVDIYPTLVEYCNLTPPKQKLDGLSFVSVLNNPKAKWDRPGLTTLGEKYSSVRSDRYRYIQYPDGTEELYDHKTDPYEHTNLANKASMKPIVAGLSKSVPSQFQKSVPTKNEDAEDDEQGPKNKAKGKKKGKK